MTILASLSVRNIYSMLYLWGGSRWPDSGQRAPVVEDDLSFTFCEKYLFYALPVRWQLLTGQWPRALVVDDELSFAFCEKYLFLALPARRQSLTGQLAKGSSLDDDHSFTSCERYLFYALPVRWHLLTGQWEKISTLASHSVRNIYSMLYLHCKSGSHKNGIRKFQQKNI